LLKQQNRQENAANTLLGLAGAMALVGKCDQAKTHVNAAMNVFRGEMGLSTAAMVYAACGDSGRAQSMIDDARKTSPKNTVLATIITPMVRAEIERNRGNNDEALRILEPIRTYDFGEAAGLSNLYLRGLLYLQQRRANEATAEFKKIIDSSGVEAFSPVHALAHLGVARAAVLSGDQAAARKAYQDFFALWKDADADLPALVAARKEYEQLKS